MCTLAFFPSEPDSFVPPMVGDQYVTLLADRIGDLVNI